MSVWELALLLVMILEHLKVGWIFWKLSYIFLIFTYHLFNFLLYIQLSCICVFIVYNKLFRIQFRYLDTWMEKTEPRLLGDHVWGMTGAAQEGMSGQLQTRIVFLATICKLHCERSLGGQHFFYFIFGSQFNNL